ncbi:MAG: carboxypeptidase-like regulatory domain-containing protein, partial [Candidatus Acidiferrales bacterium]
MISHAAIPAPPVSPISKYVPTSRFLPFRAVRRSVRVLALCLLCVLLRVPSAAAQSSGAISGTVTDASGQAVADASVTAKNVD